MSVYSAEPVTIRDSQGNEGAIDRRQLSSNTDDEASLDEEEESDVSEEVE